MATKSQIKANAKYDKAHCTGIYLKLNNKTDEDILNKLSSVPNMQGYIKQLIRDDIARTRTESAPKTEKKEGITMKRTYGNTRTHLTLEGKALEFYNMTDPIHIEETEEDGEFIYQVFAGNEPMHDGTMTEEKLIKWLEDGYDDYMNV